MPMEHFGVVIPSVYECLWNIRCNKEWVWHDILSRKVYWQCIEWPPGSIFCVDDFRGGLGRTEEELGNAGWCHTITVQLVLVYWGKHTSDPISYQNIPIVLQEHSRIVLCVGKILWTSNFATVWKASMRITTWLVFLYCYEDSSLEASRTRMAAHGAGVDLLLKPNSWCLDILTPQMSGYSTKNSIAHSYSLCFWCTR